MTTDSRFVTETGDINVISGGLGWIRIAKGRLASFLEGGDVVCPPGAEGSLGIGVFLFTHRSVVGEGLRIRGRHPRWREGERGQAGK